MAFKFLDEIGVKYLLSKIKSLVSGKADKSATLAGYGITDAYTKTQVDSLIANVGGESGGSGGNIPYFYEPLDVFDECLLEELEYSQVAIDGGSGDWEGVPGYLFDLSSFVEEDGYHPSYIQIILPTSSRGKSLIATTLSDIDGDKYFASSATCESVYYPNLQMPLLVFPYVWEGTPCLFLSGTAPFTDDFLEGTIIRFWYGGLH